MFLANSKWIHYLFREFNINFATQLWFHFLFHEFAIFFAKMQWIHYLFREFTNFFGEFTMNLLGVLRFTMDFREITIKSLFFSRIYYVFIVFIANLVRTHLIFRIHYDFSLCFAYIIWIYYLLSEFTLHSLWIHLVFR